MNIAPTADPLFSPGYEGWEIAHRVKLARMNLVTWTGLALMASSYFQLFIPRPMIDEPEYFFHGYALLPGNLLAFSAVLFTLGVIIACEGICRHYGGNSLCGFAVASPLRLALVTLCAAVAGLTLELIGQWLGKLWVYPYWTTWLYLLVVIPGFAFYWLCIVQSYLAAKAFLDTVLPQTAQPITPLRLPRALLAIAGTVCLATAAILYLMWYGSHGGYEFGVIRLSAHPVPLAVGMLAFLGVWLTAEWILGRRAVSSLIASLRRRYWVPAVALLAASLVLSLLMETQNTANHYWRYAQLRDAPATFAGVPVWVLTAWPLHYVLFLTLPALLVPDTAKVFWHRPASPHRFRSD